jgi:hypothetical protein
MKCVSEDDELFLKLLENDDGREEYMKIQKEKYSTNIVKDFKDIFKFLGGLSFVKVSGTSPGGIVFNCDFITSLKEFGVVTDASLNNISF